MSETPIIDINSYNSIFSFKKNRNNLNYLFLESQDNISKYKYEKIKTINFNSLSNSEGVDMTSDPRLSIRHSNFNSTIRCDTLLIKFKSFLGKWFIKTLNNKLKNISKRKIKFFPFNYKNIL